MQFEFIKYKKDKDKRIALITINRPEVLNAINPAANNELDAIWADVQNDSKIWVAIITGAGTKSFTVGYDLKDKSSNEWPPKRSSSGVGGLVNRFNFYKPVIAAVNGWALGAGLEICLASDIVIASENSKFGAPEVKIGGIPTGSIHRLSRQLPKKKAMEMLLTGKPIDAEKAYDFGLVNEVVKSDLLLSRSLNWAEKIASNAPLGIQAIKQVMHESDNLSLHDAMNESYQVIEEVRASSDSKEGRKAFSEKRKPVWKAK
ncbi:MAG: enoyl-CoA hydratase-related protein [Gammaproteobacteria bacterium]|nr:enoyl-CoA hydratase-related protein [Gammaproteobacteria bacterium]